MNTYIALLRGINVGGRNKLPMKAWKQQLETMGCKQVETYIQTGNAVFQHAIADSNSLATQIRAAIQTAYGFEPEVLILSAQTLKQAIEENPFAEAEAAPKTLHLYFLGQVPSQPNIKKMTEIQAAGERFALKRQVFYLHAPDGIGRSKLATKTEQLIGVAATARNWRTVTRLAKML
ncbi:MAG: DUF1697 domain-containing protein [Cyanobacteria bacterium J06607_10]